MSPDSPALLWPEDRLPESAGVAAPGDGPDTELAVAMLAAGCAQSQIKSACRFESSRAVAAFCRDPEVGRAVAEVAGQRVKRVGNRALVRLERLLAQDRHEDVRALVLAIRTGLDVSGLMKSDPAPPVRNVAELSVAELNQLIESTRAELDSRIRARGRPLAGGNT